MIKKSLSVFTKDGSGQAMTEYIIVGALICVVCLASLQLFKPALEAAFKSCAGCCGLGGIGFLL